MPDLDQLFDDLRAAPPALGSAADARRRGDRIRRRRAATTVAASALAVALTVGGVAWSRLGAPDAAPDPARPAPSPTVTEPGPAPRPTSATAESRTSIPADFPLALGWPEADGVELELFGPAPGQDSFDQAIVCGRTRDLRPEGAVARLGARLSGIVFGGDRLLVTFRDADTARAALRRTVDALDQCPRDPGAAADQEVLVSVVEPVELGDEAQQVTMGSEIGGSPGLYATVYHVVRQGNALLLAFASGEGGGSEEALAREQREAFRSLTGVVDAMCAYKAGGC